MWQGARFEKEEVKKSPEEILVVLRGVTGGVTTQNSKLCL